MKTCGPFEKCRRRLASALGENRTTARGASTEVLYRSYVHNLWCAPVLPTCLPPNWARPYFGATHPFQGNLFWLAFHHSGVCSLIEILCLMIGDPFTNARATFSRDAQTIRNNFDARRSAKWRMHASGIPNFKGMMLFGFSNGESHCAHLVA